MAKLVNVDNITTFKDQIKNKLDIHFESSNKHIELKFGQEVLAFIDATSFLVDGMLYDAEIVNQDDKGVEGVYMKFTFNADAGSKILYVDVSKMLEGVVGDINEIKIAIANKVDKQEGKGLSTNDFTNDYKNMLDNIATEQDIINIFA